MEVINLGNFGQRRPSPFADVPNALQEGLRTGAEQGKNIAELKSMQLNRSIELAKLQREVDKTEFDKNMKMAEHGKVVAEDLALKLSDMDPHMRAMALQSKPIQELVKGFKKTNPEYVDEDGNFNPPDVSKVISERTTQGINQLRLDALKRQSNPDAGYPALTDPNASQAEQAKAQSQAQADKAVLNAFRYNPDNATGNTASMFGGSVTPEQAGQIVSSHYMNPPAGVTKGSPEHHQMISQDLLNLIGKGAATAMNPTAVGAGLGASIAGPQPMAPQAAPPAQGGGADPNDPLGYNKGV